MPLCRICPDAQFHRCCDHMAVIGNWFTRRKREKDGLDGVYKCSLDHTHIHTLSRSHTSLVVRVHILPQRATREVSWVKHLFRGRGCVCVWGSVCFGKCVCGMEVHVCLCVCWSLLQAREVAVSTQHNKSRNAAQRKRKSCSEFSCCLGGVRDLKNV